MAYDFCLKKKWFGGLDPDSVTEYITKIKAENNLLKKELANKEEAAGDDNTEELRNTIDELSADIETYKSQIDMLKNQVSSLEEALAAAPKESTADNSKIAVESLNLANHYIQSAVKLTSEVSDQTILSADKSKEMLGESLDTLENFERTVAAIKAQINDVMSSFDDVSLTFEKLKKYESFGINPSDGNVSSASAEGTRLDDKAKLSLVD